MYAPTNTLIITDSADGLRRMFAFLDEADVPGFDTSMEIFTLEYTRAEVLSEQINQVLMGEGSGGPGPAPQPSRPTMPIRPVRATRPSPVPQPEARVIGSREEVLHGSGQRLNSLIVVATFNMMSQVRDLVKRLIPRPRINNNMHIYQLLNADAESVKRHTTPHWDRPRRRRGGALAARPRASAAGRPAAPEVRP